jgi:hypothetical protein
MSELEKNIQFLFLSIMTDTHWTLDDPEMEAFQMIVDAARENQK